MPFNVQRICAQCGAAFMTKTYRADRFCSVRCARDSLRRPIVKQCATCGAEFIAERKEAIYCSTSCYHAGRDYRAGPGHPDYKPRSTYACEWCGATFERLPSEIKGKPYCSKECANKGKTRLTGAARYNYKGGPYPMACEVCGTIRMVRHSMVDRFRACSKSCAAELGRRSWPRTSSLEVAMLRAFAEAGIAVEPQYPIGYYSVDFAIPEAKLIIECDGIYWHSIPAQQVRDRNKDAWLNRHGWTVLRLTEAEIRRSPAACVQRVRALL